MLVVDSHKSTVHTSFLLMFDQKRRRWIFWRTVADGQDCRVFRRLVMLWASLSKASLKTCHFPVILSISRSFEGLMKEIELNSTQVSFHLWLLGRRVYSCATLHIAHYLLNARCWVYISPWSSSLWHCGVHALGMCRCILPRTSALLLHLQPMQRRTKINILYNHPEISKSD